MAQPVRMSLNFVNLGTLYQTRHTLARQTRDQKLFSRGRTDGCGVNLGRLYETPTTKSYTGWANFEDGSVYIGPISRRAQPMGHNEIETEMKLLEPVVRQPPPDLELAKQMDPKRQQLIIIDWKPFTRRSRLHTSCSIFARNAANIEGVSVAARPFRRIEVNYKGFNHAQPPSVISRSDHVVLMKTQRQKIVNMFGTQMQDGFRGTLVGGVLHPNVRLRHGLRLNTSARFDEDLARERARTTTIPGFAEDKFRHHGSTRDSPQHNTTPNTFARARVLRPRKTSFRHQSSQDISKREAELNQRERQLLDMQQQLLKSLAIANRNSRSDRSRFPSQTDPEPDNKAAYLEAKERELQLREEMLRYKHRNLVLARKLAAVEGQSLQAVNFEHNKLAPASAAYEASDPEPSADDSAADYLAADYPAADCPATEETSDFTSSYDNHFPVLDDFTPPTYPPKLRTPVTARR